MCTGYWVVGEDGSGDQLLLLLGMTPKAAAAKSRRELEVGVANAVEGSEGQGAPPRPGEASSKRVSQMDLSRLRRKQRVPLLRRQ